MNIQEISQLDHVSLGRLTSDAYKAAFEDPTTGKQFAEKVNALESSPRPATRKAGNVRGEEPAPTPAMNNFDPSFDDDPASVPAAAQPAAEPAPQPAASAKLLLWEYQPTDSAGRPLGGKQAFRYDATLPNEHPQSLASQLTKSNMHAVRIARERKVADVIESVKPVGGYEPPKFLSVSDHPEYASLNAITESTIKNAVSSALNVFKQNHPEFVLSEENAVAMVSFVQKSCRNPADAQSWESAWQSLRPYIGSEATPATEASVVVSAPAPAPVIVTPAPAVRPSSTGRVGTGISNADVFNDEPVFEQPAKVQGVRLIIDGKAVVMDLRTWDRQSSDFQKRVLRNRANAAAINALYEAQAQQATARRTTARR